MAPSATAATAATCNCPNRCEEFELLPIDRGLMITLGDVIKDIPSPSSSIEDNGGRDVLHHPTSHAKEGEKKSSASNDCACLELHPQEDANLPQFHPNLYIPSPLLDRPERLVKYGGGGSGVTVFGGYHPLLGNLVMKHGGHKDLVELVSLAKIERGSLAKIEREMGVRGKWRMDCLASSGKDTNDISQTDHIGEGDAPQERKHSLFSLMDPTAIIHGVQHPAEVMKKIQSQNVLKTMGTMVGRLDTIPSADHLTFSGRRSKVGGGGGIDVSLTLEGGFGPEDFEREMQMQAIKHAVADMKWRIPAFRMIYISPMHLRERKEELRDNTFRSARGVSIGCVNDFLQKEQQQDAERKGEQRWALSSNCLASSDSRETTVLTANRSQERLLRRDSSVMRKGRNIHLFGSSNTKASSIHVRFDSVDLCFGGNYRCWKAGNEEENADIHSCPPQTDGRDGYASLMAFVHHLRHEQEKNDWKVTLAQQTIGQVTTRDDESESAMTASSLLAQGKLHGPLLHHLINSEIQVIRNLQLLTMPEEVDVVDQVRAEYESILSRQKNENMTVSAEQVSKMANAFVGKAIHKNFHPTKGRFVMIRQFCVDLRKGKLHLKPKEILPAKHLEMLAYRAWELADVDVEGRRHDDHGSKAMEETFNMLNPDQDTAKDARDCDQRNHHPMFVMGLDQWQSLLELSLSMKHPNATNRIWTCGLTDGGLHNMFLSEDRMWLFDLGEPNLEPVPAFLTKFLMSFLHTLGMEEDERGDWIVRFEQDDSGKLRLTEQTKELMPQVMEAFNTTVDRLIAELFGGEEGVRVLLLRYVVTQLVSDAAFCIEKWRIKGGGDERRSEHQYFLEKWLWRALWDVYVSEEIRRRYLTRVIFRRQAERRDLSCEGLDSLVE
eukprot:CAMPEP_0172580340 /NCGR_PEP_ID=MMETSP1067-20121228/139706_1 /TAXON_ID=265564 ORGANISM="Thalassiosira punctigera, Strain Tpunct2005C2" /NCGR_SAMPLE_ID=MMETSP1067 /ASSEMBLY_ACC=CAM_ASM_000444 /LENGTH=890 /DNA_ID=CAMNT_0013373079 /DNA_START=75 /DNA_END=2747 /DNA_ORIENTATION=+